MRRLIAPTGLPPSQIPTGTVEEVEPIVAPPSGLQLATSDPNAVAAPPPVMAEPAPVIANASTLQFSEESAPTHIYPEEEPMLLFSMPPNNLVNGVNYNGLIEPAAFANPAQPFYLAYDMSAAGGGGGDASLWATFPAVTAADLSGNKINNLGTPTTSTDAATKGYVDSQGFITTPATWANYPAIGPVDMNTNDINDVATLNAATTTQIVLNKGNALGPTLGDAVVVITGGGDELTGLTDPMTTVLLKAISSGGTSEEITNLAFYGFDSAITEAQYASITTNATDTTAGSTNAQMKLNVALNGASSTLLVIDGSNNTVNANTVLNMTSHKISNVTDPTLAQDAATKNYVDTRPAATLANVLLAGNSAGATSINMNSQDISNVANITNASSTLNVSANDLNLSATGALSVLNIGAVAGITLTSAGAAAINAVGAVQIGTAGLISIGSSGDNTEIEEVKFAENVISKTSGGADLVINDIATLNATTPNSVIQSKAGIAITDLSGLSDFAGFQAQNLTATTNDVVGTLAQTLISTTGDAYGAIIQDIQAQTLQATGIIINGVSGTTASTAISIVGPLTGTTQRGVYENATGTNIKNTFIHDTGIGKDPTVALDVSGQAIITSTVGGRAAPTLELVSTNATAPGTYLQFYHNSATPDVGDRAGVMDFYANNGSAIKKEYARIRTLQENITNGSEDGVIEFSTIANGSMTKYFDIDGSNNGVIINPDKDLVNATGALTIFDSQGVTTNNTLMYADASNARLMFKNYPQRYLYDISGDYTLTLPDPGWNIIRVLMTGGGGGGGSGRLDSAGSCFGGGAGSGGNVVECWYDRRELFPDASGAITLYIRVGGGGAGGAAVTTNATNGNNGAAGLQTSVTLFSQANTNATLYYQVLGGNAGSGGTNAAGSGGAAPTWGGGNFGFAGRPGASSSITAQPSANTTGSANYAGTICQPPGGSGAGGGVAAGATVAYAGGSMASPAGQYYGVPNGAGLGLQTLTVGTAGTAIAAAGNGAGFTFASTGIVNAAIRPLRGNVDGYSGGGGSINATSGGGAGGGHTAGDPGSRGSGGGGGGGATTTASGAGGRGRDGHVYITLW